MDTHSMSFVTIGNLVSPSSSVNGDPLSDFPDHWQPRFSAQFSLRRTDEGANRLAPSKRKIFPVLGCQGKPDRQAAGAVVSLVPFARQDVYSYGVRQLDMSRAAWAALVFAGPANRFLAQLFFSSNPVLDIFSVFAATLKLQLMSSASDLFSRWFSASKHGNLLGCQYGGGGRPP